MAVTSSRNRIRTDFRSGITVSVVTLALVAAGGLLARWDLGASGTNESPTVEAEDAGGSAQARHAADEAEVMQRSDALPAGVSIEVGPDAAASRPVAILLDPYSDATRIQIPLYNGDTGLRAASFTFGTAPLVVARRAARQIIVSDRQPFTTTGRVYSIDLMKGYEVSQAVKVPGRVLYSSYFPNMALSSDERYLAVTQLVNRDEIPACQPGGPNLVCDSNRVTLVDLDTMTVSGEVGLPQGCGLQRSYASPRGFVVVCSDSGHVAEVSPAGEILGEADFSTLPGMQLNSLRPYSTALTFAAVVDGRFVVYRTDGLMIAEDGTSTRVIPEGEVLDELFLLPGDLFVGRLRIPTTAYVVFDLRTFEVLALHEVPGLSSIAPAGGEQIWSLSDGVVELRNALTGQVVSDVRIEVGEDAYLLP